MRMKLLFVGLLREGKTSKLLQIRNPKHESDSTKHEIRNNSQNSNFKIFLNFILLSFVFVSYFEFRYSNLFSLQLNNGR